MQVKKYEVAGTEVRPFTYRPPIITVDDNGELCASHPKSKGSSTHIKRITFLNLVARNEKGNIVSYEPMENVNRFLMSVHIDEDREESAQHSKGLIHFFSWFILLQEKWDDEYDEELFDKEFDIPRPKWDWMAFRESDRITYQYRSALKDLVLKPGKEKPIARTTATAYMSTVIKFYSFHLRHGKKFNNPPFKHEVISISFQAGGTNMKPYMTKDIHTTDLRLNFPKSQRNEGGTFPEARRDLRPLTKYQWDEVEKILTKTRRVIKNVKGSYKLVALAEEYCLFFLIGRFTGLRKEEVASLHAGQIVKPELNDPLDCLEGGTETKGRFKKACLRLGVGDEYGSLTKSKEGGNKSRKTIIEPGIMQLMYEYTLSPRYKKRLVKFRELCKAKRESGEDAFFDSLDGVDENKKYLFLSSSGIPFFLKLNELNNRWNEVRNTVKEILGGEFRGTIHNLRPTFAVGIFRSLLKRGMPTDKAIAIVADLLGHEDLATTLLYLKVAQDAPTGDEVWEDALDFSGVFDVLGNMEDDLARKEEE